MNTTKTFILTALAAALATAGIAQADVVALKRGPDLTVGAGLDAAFQSAITGGTIQVYSGQGMAADVDFYCNPNWAGYQTYYNFGTRPSISYGNAYFLSKFDVQDLPGFAGGRINKAQLRFYYQAGNTGLDHTGYVTSSDWTEGTKNGGYPGAEGGASFAHPNGKNTGADQNADGGTEPPLQSWANNDYFNVANNVSVLSVSATRTRYTDRGDTYGGFAAYDVTPIVHLGKRRRTELRLLHLR